MLGWEAREERPGPDPDGELSWSIGSLDGSGPPALAIRSAHYSIIGRRMSMEDYSVTLPHPQYNADTASPDPHTPRSFFALFDGHGGHACAEFMAKILHHKLADSKHLRERKDAADTEPPLPRKKACENAIRDAILDSDELFLNYMSVRVGSTSSGSTVIAAFLENDLLTVANVGDSRAVLCRKGAAVALSSDHKPSRPDERKRIIEGGGTVGRSLAESKVLSTSGDCVASVLSFLNNVWFYRFPFRIYPGGLAISRSLGDLEIKRFGNLIAEPEIRQEYLTPIDEFIILACDGLWDVLSSSEAVQMVKEFRKTNPNHPTAAAKLLVETAFALRSTDNISVIVVYLNWEK